MTWKWLTSAIGLNTVVCSVIDLNVCVVGVEICGVQDGHMRVPGGTELCWGCSSLFTEGGFLYLELTGTSLSQEPLTPVSWNYYNSVCRY